MRGIFRSAMVIARRDFTATVMSRTFLLFLLAPVIALGFGGLIGGMAGEADAVATQPSVAVVSDIGSGKALLAARARLAETLGPTSLPNLVLVKPEEGTRAQVRQLLSSTKTNFSAVFTGTLAEPTLTGPQKSSSNVAEKMALIVDDARRSDALRSAGAVPQPVKLNSIISEQSAGSLKSVRYGLARAGQALIFMLTILLASMLLSNLVEEKSSKVIEVLAAAVPLDAVFLGKLIAMLGVSAVGILVWGSLAAVGIFFVQNAISMPVTPAVGWPAYCLLLVLYFAANYLLLGAMFLGIGGQASNVREVQTLSMPITFAQLAIFFLAGTAVGNDGGTMTYVAAIFPLSSPLAMIGVAAQSPTLWIHAVAIIWQLVWTALFIRMAAAMFKATVLKSGKSRGFFDAFRFKKA